MIDKYHFVNNKFLDVIGKPRYTLIFRAILERFGNEITFNNSDTIVGGRRKAEFASDQSIPNGISRPFSFRFRLDQWIDEYEIVEVSNCFDLK